MARRKRIKSKTQIYHVIIRGINKQTIFFDEDDYYSFLDVLRHYHEVCDFDIYAYCLMHNHVHLLVKENGTPVSEVIRRIEIKFIRGYNKKYQRTGGLFENRYKSEAVENTAYLLTAFRYIHQNPLHAGIETAVGDYPWSSFGNYLNQKKDFLSLDVMNSYFSNPQELITFLKEDSKDQCMEDNNISSLNDQEALQLILNVSHCSSISEFKKLPYITQCEYLSQLLYSSITIHQASRITGIPYKFIMQL